MTAQEAIEILKTERNHMIPTLLPERIEAMDMAISTLEKQEETVSRKVYEQISWERDIAVMQLKDLGYGLGEKIRTDGDTISRQAAIDALEKIPVREFKKTDGLLDALVSIGQVYRALKQLSSAQTEPCGQVTGKLEPCPFCGNEPTISCFKGKDGWRDRYAVICRYDEGGCGAESGLYHYEAEALEAWNRRVGETDVTV